MRILITTADYSSYRIHFDALADGAIHQWGDAEFHYVPDGNPYDAWVVWQSNQGLPDKMTVECPVERTLLVLREPPDIITLPLSYTNQFAAILGPDNSYDHPCVFFEQFGQVWHLEKSAAFLRSCSPPEKTGWISAVTSTKSGTEGQKRRLLLLEALKTHFKDKLDHYGRGVRPTDSKWDAVSRYRYHLTLENGCWPHYWTEKLSDSFLGWSLPIYVGAPNVSDYFEARSIVSIDRCDTRTIINRIEQIMEDDLYTHLLPAIDEARKKILNYYHLYPTIIRSLNRMRTGQKVSLTLCPSSDFPFSTRQSIKFCWRNLRQKLVHSRSRSGHQ